MTIVEELRQNRESGSKRLEAEYKAGLMTLARRFCADESDAAELVNRTFSAVVEGINDYLEQSAFFAWMCQILTNIHSMDVRRKSNRTVVYPGDVPDTTDEKSANRIEEEVDASLLRDAVQRLPADQRELLLLHYFMDMPVAKIAKFLSIPQGTVMSRLHYARKALAAKLGMAAKKPGVKALLIALVLAALTAIGAAVVIAVGDGGTGGPNAVPVEDERFMDASLPESGTETEDYREQSATDNSPAIQLANSPTNLHTNSPASPLSPTTGDAMNRTTAKNTASALLAATTLAVASGTANLRAATTYTWLASPADANWNTSSLNWTTDGTDAVAWVNNADDPNSAVFGDSSQKEITVGGNRRIGNLTINKNGYTFKGSSCNLYIYDTMTVDGNTTFSGKVSSGLADGSLRLTSTASSEVTVNFNSSQNAFTTIYLNGTFVFVPILDNALGPKPATRTENIVVTDGSPTLFGGTYNGKSFTVNSNRIVKIASGKSLKLASNYTFTLGGPIIAEPTEGYDYSRNTHVQVRGKSGWEGLIVFDPGAGVTNAFGRLKVAGRGKIASGVTRVSGPGGSTEDTALLYVARGSSATEYSDKWGNLLIDGGELYASQQVNANVSYYGQVTVTNFGKVYMPKVDWLNGSSGRGKLTVAKDGAFTVNLLRISQSSSLSEVHLNEGGLIEASLLCIDPAGKRNGKFRFNGGRLRSREAKNPFFASTGGTSLAEDKAAYVTFAVGEKGAVFDTELKNLYWNRPLVSDPATGFDKDGGLHKIGGNILILTSTNCYNGVTWIEGNDAQLRVDNALPPGTTLRLSDGGFVTAYTFEKETPQRSTEQWIGRVEGSGALKYMTQSHVTNAIAPSVDGTIKFESRCDLSGDFEVSGNAAGCSRLQVAAGQDISGLTLKVEDFSTFNGKATREHYQILSAPDGYTGTFALPAEWADDWKVIYTDTGAYLWAKRPLIIVIR